jgi:hypothetical protein
VSENKAMLRRLVEAINAGEEEAAVDVAAPRDARVSALYLLPRGVYRAKA